MDHDEPFEELQNSIMPSMVRKKKKMCDFAQEDG